jgi:hypothetical protein
VSVRFNRIYLLLSMSPQETHYFLYTCALAFMGHLVSWTILIVL